MELKVGLTHEASWTVDATLLASALGSGGVPVFATPALVALCEEAAFRCVMPALAAGQSTVGSYIALRHLAATPPGQRVRAVATLVGVEGRALRFTLEAWDEQEKIGEGEHERFIIDEAKFLARAAGKQSQQPLESEGG